MKFPTYQPFTKFISILSTIYLVAVLLVAAYCWLQGTLHLIPIKVWSSSLAIYIMSIALKVALDKVSTISCESEGLLIHKIHRVRWADIESAKISPGKSCVKISVVQKARPTKIAFVLGLNTYPEFATKAKELFPAKVIFAEVERPRDKST